MPQTKEDLEWFKSTFHPIPKPTLPDDCIEYTIYLVSTDLDPKNDSELRTRLRDVQKHSNELQKQWLKGYIWQRQGFSLELAKEDGEVGTLSAQDMENFLTKCVGISLLKGRTEYGDSIEDEWAVVWMLRELTKKFNDLWIKVTDSDGEFLLIEASGTIPNWLEPDVAENRVWINNGQLKIIKSANAARSSKRTTERISLQDARQVILQEPNRILHSASIEEEAFYRLRNYPGQIQENMHHAMITVPRKVAFLLRQRPAYISSAIEAFYLRDPISLKPLQDKEDSPSLNYPPKDLVTLSAKFPKVGYAQVKAQDFPAPPVWKQAMPSASDPKAFATADTGMKITCGFEMLLNDPQHQDKQTVREMKMLLDDLNTGDEVMPSNADIEKLDKRQDDEKWLDIDFHDLEQELAGRSHGGTEGKKAAFGDQAAQENLQRIVKQFEDFLNDKDDYREDGMFDESSESGDNEDEGPAGDMSDDDEDAEASFDEDEFTKMMQEMMGMPADVMQEVMSGTIDALSADGPGRASAGVRERARAKIQEVDSSDEDIEDTKQMEHELRASGALDLNPRTGKQLDRGAHQGSGSDDGELTDDDQGVNDFDADFARNILQSFRSSGGMGGPAANLMSMMNDSATASSSAGGKNKSGRSK